MLPGNKHNILLEFETVVDIDYGVLQLVEEKYEQDDRFYHQLMYLGDKQIKGLIHNNDSNNPVRILMDIEDYDEADRIYSDIMENEIDKVLEKSVTTNLYEVCKNGIATAGMCNVNIICSREEYANYANKLFEDYGDEYLQILYHDFGIPGDEEPFNCEEYTCLFLRYITSLFNYDNLMGKSVFIQECYTNMDMKLYYSGVGLFPDSKVCMIHAECNRIFIFSPYNYTNEYFVNFDYPYDTEVLPVFEPEEIDEDMDSIIEEFDVEDDAMDLFNDRIGMMNAMNSMYSAEDDVEDIDDINAFIQELSPADASILANQLNYDNKEDN